MNKIYENVRYLCEEIGNRLPGSKNEKRTADWIAEKIRSFSQKPIVEEFYTPTSAYSFLQFVFLFGLLLSFFYFQLHPLLKIIFLVLEILLGLLFYLEFNFLHTFIYRLFKKKKSQNVYTEISSKNEEKKKVFISAHMDSATAGVIFKPKIVNTLKLQVKLVLFSFIVLFINSLLYLFWPKYFFLIIFMVLGFFYFISFLIAFHTEYLAKPTDGANDNASSIGVSLALIEYFSKNRLNQTKVTGLYTGSEEAGCIGIYEFLNNRRYLIDPDAYFIVLDCTGIGNPVYLKKEGMLKEYHADKEMISIADKVSNEVEYKCNSVALPVGYTEYNVIKNFGYKGMAVGAVPCEKNSVPNWHQVRDRIIFIRPETLDNVFDFIKRIIFEIDEK